MEYRMVQDENKKIVVDVMCVRRRRRYEKGSPCFKCHAQVALPLVASLSDCGLKRYRDMITANLKMRTRTCESVTWL